MRPAARLALLVWQRYEHNEWARAIDAALGDTARQPHHGADPFSLGDPRATARLLGTAGFEDIQLEDIDAPVLYGHDLDAALAFIHGFQSTTAALAGLNDDYAQAEERPPHLDDTGELLITITPHLVRAPALRVASRMLLVPSTPAGGPGGS